VLNWHGQGLNQLEDSLELLSASEVTDHIEKGGETMNYSKPEIVVLGKAGLVIQGKPSTPAQDPNQSLASAYDLDE